MGYLSYLLGNPVQNLLLQYLLDMKDSKLAPGTWYQARRNTQSGNLKFWNREKTVIKVNLIFTYTSTQRVHNKVQETTRPFNI